MYLTSLLLTLTLLLTTALASLESWEDSYLAYAAHSPRRPAPRMVKRALAQPRIERRTAAGFVSEQLDANELPSVVAGGPVDRKRPHRGRAQR